MYTMLTQRPEAPLTEKWVWRSDVIVADDGSEQRISLSSVPKRSWSGVISFDSEASVRRQIALMFAKFKEAFYLPLFHMQVYVKQAVAAGASTIYCNTARSDLRSGSQVWLFNGDSGEAVTIDTIASDHVTLTGVTISAYKRGSKLCPITLAYSGDNSAVVRRAVNGFALYNFTFFEYGFLSPFIEEADIIELEEFDGYPLLLKRGIGDEFNIAFNTGMEITDYGGVQSLRSRWETSKLAMSLSFKCDPVDAPEDWTFWQTFAEYCRGSTNPFYLPTYREDFEIHTEAAGGGSTIVLEGHEYNDHFYVEEAFRKIAISKPDGTQHFATVTACVNSAGNDQLTFTPALPGGDWGGQTISLLLKCRLADDTVSTMHYGSYSIVTLNIRTTE